MPDPHLDESRDMVRCCCDRFPAPHERTWLCPQANESGEDPAVLTALAAEVNGRAEFRSYIQDIEGRWYWAAGVLMPVGRGTWNADLYDDQVRVEGRIVSDWQPIDRSKIEDA